MATILIVDDSHHNIQALRLTLKDTQHAIVEATDGLMALEVADRIKPDLVLLDIMMPLMDGFEVCKALRASPVHAQVPVIFVTALDDSAEKVRAFEVGGNDYVTKPFSMVEVAARVHAHLELYLKRKELEAIRQKELDFFRRLNEARDDLLEQLRHDVKSPLSRIKVAAYMVARSANDDAALQKYIQSIDLAVLDVVNLVETLTEIIKLETGRYVQTRPTLMLPFLDQIAQSHRAAVELKGITFRVDLEAVAPEAMFDVDPPQIQRVLGNLIDNAVKFTDAGGAITLMCSVDGDRLRMSVSDTGCGIEPAALAQVFQRFYRSAAARDREGSGLGLYIAQQLVLQHQGEIRVESEAGRGSTFIVLIPRPA